MNLAQYDVRILIAAALVAVFNVARGNLWILLIGATGDGRVAPVIATSQKLREAKVCNHQSRKKN
jgi:hypothetical protein